ncbi:MAG: hypothetical protein IJ630_05325 [Treponema sp.]|nr:hypothetical protein [Treponema sp.]
MKKPNFVVVIALFLAMAISLFSCKSTPDIAPVDAFELLDGDAALYLTVPVQANSEFVTNAIQKIGKIAESDAKKITERLDMAYVAILPSGKIQLSASGNLPKAFASLALSEKNGWTAGAKEGHTFYTHKDTGFELCIPSSSNVFLAGNISQMAKRYNKIAYSDLTSDEKLLSQAISQSDYKYLHENISSNMMLYSPSPRFLLKNFFGALDVKTPVTSVYAAVSPYSEVKGYDYNVKLVLNLSDARTVKATEALLKVGLFGMASKISQTGQAQITIVELLLKKSQILALIK